MSFIAEAQLTELVAFAWMADREVRDDLANGLIRGEDDYTSNFTKAFRSNISLYSKTGLKAQTFLLGTSEERTMGVDAAIILSTKTQSKVAVFEAKMPRFKKRDYRWDKIQKKTKQPHFSDQLTRQRLFVPNFAVFEMFYCDYPLAKQPSYLQDFVSSCVWYHEADKFNSTRKAPTAAWDQSEAQALIGTYRHTIAEIMFHFGMCHAGTPMRRMKPRDIVKEYRLNVPVLTIQGISPTHGTTVARNS